MNAYRQQPQCGHERTITVTTVIYGVPRVDVHVLSTAQVDAIRDPAELKNLDPCKLCGTQEQR